MTEVAAEPILVIGAGGVGGSLAASLVAAGERVTVVDANAAHVDAIAERGLTVQGVRPATVRLTAAHPDALEGRFSRVILAVKARDTLVALDLAAEHLADDGWVMPLQNGLGLYEVAGRFGAARTIGAVIAIGAHYRGPGRVALLGYGETHVGELGGEVARRTREAARLLGTLQPTRLTNNIKGHAWGKLVLSVIYSATALADADVPSLLDDAWVGRTLAAVGREAVLIAKAEGVDLEPADGLEPLQLLDCSMNEHNLRDLWDGQRQAWRRYETKRTGIWQDLAVHRRPTEVQAFLAPVLAAATRHGIATPHLDRLGSLIAEVESGRTSIGAVTFARLAEASAASTA